jgi:signal transduction histidine kinase
MRRAMIREVNAVQRTLRIASALMRERAEARARVRQMREVLDRAQRMESVGQAMAGVAHDFGNLVFVIGGNLEQLRPRLGAQSPERALLETALRLTGKAQALVSLLSSGGRHNGREPRELDVGESIAELGDLLRDVVGESTRLTIRIAPDLRHCYLDPILFKSALCNLAINARHAMPRGGEVRIDGSNIWLDESQAAAKELAPGAYVVIAVSDSGVGIAPDLISRIFDPFVTTQQPARGAGLGLSIVYGFVRTSGGHVEVASEPGRRTTFTMYFPAVGAAPTDRPHPAPAGMARTLTSPD